MNAFIILRSIVFFLILFLCSGCSKKKSSALVLNEPLLITESNYDKNALISRMDTFKKGAETKGKRNKKNEQNQQQSDLKQQRILKQKTYKQIEAGLVDIPIPLLAKPVCVSGDTKETYRLDYFVVSFLVDIKAFYTSEMERSGWDTGVSFSTIQETVLSFKKQTGSCVIILKPKTDWCGRQKGTIVSLYVS